MSGGIILYRVIRESISEGYHGTIWVSGEKISFLAKGAACLSAQKQLFSAAVLKLWSIDHIPKMLS